jgi:hypothetical protein
MNADWLTQLAPEHAPPPPGWWPLAPGWWAVGTIGVLLIAGAIWWWRNPRLTRQRKALHELQRIRDQLNDQQDIAITARAIQNLLRRYAIAVFGRDRVAQLTGNAWLTFLNDHGGAPSADAGQSLLAIAFGGPPTEQEIECHRNRCEQWFAGADAFLRRAGKSHARSKLQ